MLVKLGGGVKDVEVRVLDSLVGPMVVVHLLVDTGDAMGANAVNTMAEAVAPFLEELTGGRAELRILSKPGRPPNRPRPRRLQEGRHWRGKGCR